MGAPQRVRCSTAFPPLSLTRPLQLLRPPPSAQFTKFTKACERHGRDNFKEIAAEVGTKSDAEVQTYSAAFWDKGALYIQDFDKVQRRIEDGERKIKEKEKMTETLAQKVRSCDNPWQTLTIKYGNNRGKLFTEDEDRFLVCMTNELGYGKWDELKREVRNLTEISRPSLAGALRRSPSLSLP